MKDSAATPGRRAGSADEPSPVATGLEALSWAVSSGAAGEVVRHVEARRRRRVRRRIAGVAGIACLGLVGAWLFPQAAATSAVPPIAAVSTVVVAPETRTLADGSIVELRPGAAIRVEYGPSSRRVVLLAGEVHFQVTKDAARPFVVVASGVEVRAVGTAFSVDLGKRAVDVLVTEGTVRVTPPNAEPADEAAPGGAVGSALVEAGHRATVEILADARLSLVTVSAVSAAEIARSLAWQAPMVDLAGATVRELAAGFAQRTGRRIEVADRALAAVRIGGRLPDDDVEGFVRALEEVYGVLVERRPDGVIVLRNGR